MNIEHRTSNIEHPTSNIQHRTSNIEHRTGGKGSATPLWLARRGVRAESKRRRRCALPAHSKGPACRLSSELLFKLRPGPLNFELPLVVKKNRNRDWAIEDEELI